MSAVLQSKNKINSLVISLLAIIVAIGIFPFGKMPPQKSKNFLLPAVTIKTQSAANNVPNGIRGIDVSEYQGNINWETVSKGDVNFAICRASYGLKADKNFYINARGAHANGILVGAYHYAKFTNRATMEQEAALFLKLIKNVDITYPVFLDIEANRGLSKNSLAALAVEFMDIIKAAGYTPMLYSYTNFYRDYLPISKIGDYEIWVANYVEEPKIGQKIWQHTSYGSVKGIVGRVDINIAYADLATKKKLRVNGKISETIKQTLNSRHDSGLPVDTLNIGEMKIAVNTALQSELIRQLGVDIEVTGEMNAETLNAIETVAFNLNQTKGNMTYLLQVMLFYKGHYTQQLTGVYDDNTSEAIKKFQSAQGIEVTGATNRDTLWYLFR